MRIRSLLASAALTGALFAALEGGAAATNPNKACMVGVIVGNSAGPGFGQETAAPAHAGTLDPASVAAAYCR